MEQADHVGAVVHGDLRMEVDDRVDVAVVGVVVLTLDGVGGDAVLGHEGRRDVVLSGERVGGAEAELGATGGERAHEAGGLARHVQAGADANTLERLLLGEALADLGQHRHFLLSPLDPQYPARREGQIFHIMVDHYATPSVVLLASHDYDRRGHPQTQMGCHDDHGYQLGTDRSVAVRFDRLGLECVETGWVEHAGHHSGPHYHTLAGGQTTGCRDREDRCRSCSGSADRRSRRWAR